LADTVSFEKKGVLCDGMAEYFETSRRTYARAWPGEAAPSDAALPAFRRLRPVIMTGWEMPLLLRAIATGRAEAAILRDWRAVRDDVVRSGLRPGDELVGLLKTGLDEVRREWIAADRRSWIERNTPYVSVDELRRLVAEPGQAVLVTTKEGEFARFILDDWGVMLADIEGKEAGTHKCDNLRALIAAFEKAHGRRPALAFVEDRLETLEHVTTHDDLADVRLFLAAWGYNTAETRASLRPSGRVRLLELDQFRRGLNAWP